MPHRRLAVKPKRRAVRIAARNPRRTGRTAWGVAKLAGRNPRATRGGAKALRAVRRRRPARSRLVFTGALAALGVYFLDPRKGKRRRGAITGKAGEAARQGKSGVESKARHAEGVAAGAVQGVKPDGGRVDPEARLNDPSLARKVESEIFRDPEAPKGAVSVSVENGVVFLRGQLEDSGQREKLAVEAGKVDGVREVQNLLHGPGDEAPAKSDGGAGSGAA